METLNSNDPAFLETCHRWLMFNYHCRVCEKPEETCPYGKTCSYGKSTFSHVRTCPRTECTFPRCDFIKFILRHHQLCKDEACRVCSPVFKYQARTQGPDPPPCLDPSVDDGHTACLMSSASSAQCPVQQQQHQRISQLSQSINSGSPLVKRNSCQAELDTPPAQLLQPDDQPQSRQQQQQQQQDQQNAGVLFEARHREHKRQMSGSLSSSSWPVDARAGTGSGAGASTLSSVPSASLDAAVELQALHLDQSSTPGAYQQQAPVQTRQPQSGSSNVLAMVQSGSAEAANAVTSPSSGQPPRQAAVAGPSFLFASASPQLQPSGAGFAVSGDLGAARAPAPLLGQQQHLQQQPHHGMGVVMAAGIAPQNTAPPPQQLATGLQLQQPLTLGVPQVLGQMQLVTHGAMQAGASAPLPQQQPQHAFSIPVQGPGGPGSLTAAAALQANGPTFMTLPYGSFMHAVQQPLQLVSTGPGVSYALVHPHRPHADTYGSAAPPSAALLPPGSQFQHHHQQQLQQLQQFHHHPPTRLQGIPGLAPAGQPGFFSGPQPSPGTGVTTLHLGCGPAADGGPGTTPQWPLQMPGVQHMAAAALPQQFPQGSLSDAAGA